MISVPRDSIPPALETAARRVRRHFVIDTRALAALRITLGGILLFDLLARAGNFDLLYSADGLYPLSVHAAAYGSSGLVSLHALSDAAVFQRYLPRSQHGYSDPKRSSTG
ncbi:MAG: hypothetical protein RI560_08035 [Natronomonas sp.]|uniref:hypothetical protein n=1 Tax=Natronomonas sp. TaxID=2184060 RepID=UPI00286FFEAA|nr:hypothetical protein [Natronomonas sp.]MDR9381604.1 hypothetical protein [Natronomonas sp.]MDR9430416.1 hypothetical protein [Natronomonas sp.]